MANSEAVALVHVVYFGRARAVNGWFRVGAVHLQGLFPGPNAYCGAISGVCVGIPYVRTETYETLHTYRTLAVSEAVALRTEYGW